MLLLDMGLLGMNGVEAARRVRALAPNTAILTLTAFDDAPYISAMLEVGVSGYLLKTCPSEELVAAVRAASAGEFVLSSQVAQEVLRHQFANRSKDTRKTGGELLSDREREVLRLAAKGLTNKAIARKMLLSARTVQAHLAHSYRKLDVSSRTEAVMAGVSQRWLHVEDAG